MTKNVTITDENGTYVGTTYPKRAKGLVKNGRALFVDDCTIRLSGKTEPSEDILNQSEVKQMNYIYFNPREWSSEQTQYNTQYQNGNGFYHQTPYRQADVERSFINDFDGSLIESLMFGGWDDAYVRVSSGNFSLQPDTENCFVFWLNGGENDKNSEICQLQIIFFNNPSDCYTYKLNRNYIKPLLHRQGWELYSIPFKTPFSEQTSVDTRFSFVAGNAPMAVKPAKDLSFYQDWEDEPDEFAGSRPQRHNLVFEDGWPTIHMYGGDKYSTEVLRQKRGSGFSGQHRQVIHGVAENVQQMAQGFATNAKQMAKGLAQNTRQLAEFYRDNAEQRKNQADDWTELSEKLDACKERQTELNNRQEELSERRHDLQMRYKELLSRYHLKEEEKSQLNASLGETTEWDSSFPALLALDAQCNCAFDMISKQYVPIEAVAGLLDGIENQLDSIKDMLDCREDMLDELCELIEEIEDENATSEEE